MSTKIQISGNMQSIPLDQLTPWASNPRTRTTRQAIEQLKANLKAGGLLQNLIAVPDPQGGYLVIAGASRLAALKELAETNEIPAEEPIVCAVRQIDVTNVEALRTALSENAVRQQMEPIDEAHAMAEMRRMGEAPASIAVAFGLSEKVVKQRIALGNLVTEAQELIRDKARDLDWGKAVSMADTATQTKICSDIQMNPAAWKDGQEVRRFLTADTIPAEHALFDVDHYQGRIIRDMFDGDKLVDRDEFWTLQNAAIDNKKADLEATGYQEVAISHQPVDRWRFQESDTPSQSIAIIEVAPNGKVITHTGLVKVDDAPVVEEAEDDVTETQGQAAIAPEGVRMTPAVCDYVAAHRSAMLQANLSDDFRSCLEITVAGLLGHSGLNMRAQDYRYPGGNQIRTGEAFARVGQDKEAVQESLRAGGVGQGGHRDHEILAMVTIMDDDALSQLFTRLVAGKVGQHATRQIDGDPESLTNALGQRLQVDVRAHWTPDEAFFELMQTKDLVRLGETLLPADRKRGLAGAKRKHVVKTLADAFAAAAEKDGSIDPADARRLNAWIPGCMGFPAHDDTVPADAEGEGEGVDASVHDALFNG